MDSEYNNEWLFNKNLSLVYYLFIVYSIIEAKISCIYRYRIDQLIVGIASDHGKLKFNIPERSEHFKN